MNVPYPSVAAINIYFGRTTVQRVIHSLTPVHSAASLSIATMDCNAMPDSRFQSNFSNGCVNAVFNYSMPINDPNAMNSCK